MLALAQNKTNYRLKLPDKLFPIINSKHRFKVLYGGRGGAKSWAVADVLIFKAIQENCLILCTREIQNTIKDSVHRALAQTIERHGLSPIFDIKKDYILCTKTGARFIFKGLKNNATEIKSTEGVKYCYVEEANNVSVDSWEVLIPTIRLSDSQFYINFNPKHEDDPVIPLFVNSDRDDILKININYNDNPYFPDVLRAEMEYMKRVDYSNYLHIWKGQFKKNTDSCIFEGKFEVKSFETPSDAEFNFGADWGFSQDPTTLNRFFILDKTLYIDYESRGIGVEIDDLPKLFDEVPGSRDHVIIADNARPELISYMNSKGFTVKACKKGKDSIVEGIEYLRSFEKIVIHSRCRYTADEFALYSYKTDVKTNEILRTILDKHNHHIDGLRYGTEPLRKYNNLLKTPIITLKDIL